MNSACAGLRLLVIRPARPADPLTALVQAQGGEVIALPVLAIVPARATDPAIVQRFRDLHVYAKAIFVSRHAASLSLAWLDRYWPQWPARVQCFAVGRTTAQPLRDRGVPVICPPDDCATSEGLLATPELASPLGQRVLIIAGEGGRELLRTSLSARGALVETCALYRRALETRHREQIVALLTGSAPPLVVAHSAELLDALAALVGPEILARPTLTMVVPGPRVAAHARRLGGAQGAQVVVATSALAPDMVAAVAGWYTRN